MSGETGSGPTRVAIYTRISQDPKQTGLGVERQLEDCKALAERLGFTVVAVYTDNHKSAFKDTVRRPGYDAILDDIKNGRLDVVIAYKVDRFSRRLRQLIDFYELLLETGVIVHTVSGGETDLTTANGIAMAQMAAVMAENYVRTSRENNLRMRRQIAEKGGRHKCARVYGWEDDGIKVRESEAVYVREMVARLIGGESPTGIAKSLNNRNIPTMRGSKWQGLNVRKAATRASNAGLREHKGVIYPGNWEAIIDRDTWDRVILAVDNRQNMPYKRGTGRKYLLTGLAVCGNCGNRLSATVGSGKRKASYRCHTGKSSGYGPVGCGKVSRNIEPLEMLVTEAVLYRLDSPQLLQSLQEQQDDREAVSTLLKQRQGLQERLDELVHDYYTDKLITKAQFVKAKAALEVELETVSRKLGTLGTKRSLGGVDLRGKFRDTWGTSDLPWKLSVLELLIDKVVVHPYEPHAKVVSWEGFRFDPALVDIRWIA